LPLPQLWLPHLFTGEIGLPEIDRLVGRSGDPDWSTFAIRTRSACWEPGPNRTGSGKPDDRTRRRRRQKLTVVNGLLDLIRKRRDHRLLRLGGVGKTTTAAAIAVEGARQGRRTCVVTIDPARRLADAFGLDSLTNEPGRVDGAWSGELWALMLDTKSTFDAAVIRYARDQAQAQADPGESVSTATSATPCLEPRSTWQSRSCTNSTRKGASTLIVVDTPPTHRAVDFLTAPWPPDPAPRQPGPPHAAHAQPCLSAGRVRCHSRCR